MVLAPPSGQPRAAARRVVSNSFTPPLRVETHYGTFIATIFKPGISSKSFGLQVSNVQSR